MSKHPHLKRGLLAAAALATLAPMAQAQSSVTLYGRVDLGVQYTNRVNAAGDDLTELASGGILPSIWGLRGSEDLGGGLSGFFNLEGHFAADSGATISGTSGSNKLFRRQANVGLKGGWGSVALGQQYTPAILAHLGTDPRGMKEQLSMLYPFAFNQNPANPGNDLGIFTSNAISYSGSFGPVNFGASYSFGEDVADFQNGQSFSVGGAYKGPVEVSLSYQEINTATTDLNTRQWGLGAAMPLGAFKLKALFFNTKSDAGVLVAGRSTDVNAWGVGADWNWANNTTTLAYYQARDRDFRSDETKTIILSNDYALSKRTTLYAQAAYADADPGASALTSVSLRAPVPGRKTTILGLGVKHDF